MNRHDFFEALGPQKADDLKAIQTAYWLAKEAHRVSDSRDTGERYFEHPRRVAASLVKSGFVRRDAVIMALLHDVIEDTYTPPSVIVDLFGSKVYRGLALLSKKAACLDEITGQVTGFAKKGLGEYFSALTREGDVDTRLVKCADRLDNLLDCSCWTPERKRRYVEETRRFILPLAQKTDATLAEAIEKANEELEAGLALLSPND
jgi:(p)ppGpp synthase/HD superfamily hydrolase